MSQLHVYHVVHHASLLVDDVLTLSTPSLSMPTNAMFKSEEDQACRGVCTYVTVCYTCFSGLIGTDVDFPIRYLAP